MSESQPKSKEFVVFMSSNPKEGETYIFYLQWTGNEERLGFLKSLFDKCDMEDVYDMVNTNMPLMQLDIKCRLSEEVVDAHMKIDEFNSYQRMFNKCEGEFYLSMTPEDQEYWLSLDKYKLGLELWQDFGRVAILHRFAKKK